MSCLRLKNLSFSYGGPNILDGVDLIIDPGERIGLLGRNGAGKSTLMKLIEGVLAPDVGQVERSPGLKIARMAQEVPRGTDHLVFDEVAGALGEQGALIGRVHALQLALGRRTSPEIQKELDFLQEQIDSENGWKLQQQVETVIGRMNLDPEAPFESLSSGMKRRVLLAGALVSDPDVLLLDEPTNHLDIESIAWLEDFLLKEPRTLLFITHDRMFLQRLATRIIEVERGRLFDWVGTYGNFLERKEAALDAEAKQEALFDRKLAEEEVWIRTGIKARRTRNEGRVRALEKMRSERAARREKTGNVRLVAQEVERSGNLVIDARNLSHSFGEKSVLRDVSALITRGDKIGILGPNGSGKTTLLRALLGELVPQSGTIRQGTSLQIAYFDQLRAQLDEEKSAAENVADGNDRVQVNGNTRHVLGYLRDFLFTEERARSLVRYLSGGERNRLLLARMFTKPANLLVLDEPTNDLDAETLELLEEMLVDYPGTVLLVSHDRAFLNNVVTSTLVFEGDGRVKEFAGGYDDWVRQRSVSPAKEEPSQSRRAAPEPPRAKAEKPRRLSYKEQRELEMLPQKIESLEAEQAELQQRLADPAFYQQPGPEIAKVTGRSTAIAEELQASYARWEELEAIPG